MVLLLLLIAASAIIVDAEITAVKKQSGVSQLTLTGSEQDDPVMEIKNKLLRLNDTLHKVGLDSRMQRQSIEQLISHFDLEVGHDTQKRKRRSVLKKGKEVVSKILDGFEENIDEISDFNKSTTLGKVGIACDLIKTYGKVFELLPGKAGVAGKVVTSFAGLGSSILGQFTKKKKKSLTSISTEAVEDAKAATAEKIDLQTKKLEKIISVTVEDAKNAVIDKIDQQTERLEDIISEAIEDGRRADYLAKYEGEITMMMERQVLLIGLITMNRNLTRFELDMLSGEQWYFAGAGFLGALKSLIEEDLRTVDQITARRVARYLISFIKLSIAQRSMRLMFSGLMLFHGQPTNLDLQAHRDEQALQLLNQLTALEKLNCTSNLIFWQFEQPEMRLIESYYKSLGGLQLPCRLPKHARKVQTLQEDYYVARLLNPQKMVALKYGESKLHSWTIENDTLLSSTKSTHQWPGIDFIRRMTSYQDRIYFIGRKLQKLQLIEDATAVKSINTTFTIIYNTDMAACGNTLLVHERGTKELHVFHNDTWVSTITLDDNLKWPNNVYQMELRHGQLFVGDWDHSVIGYRYSDTPSPSISGPIWGPVEARYGRFVVMSDHHILTRKKSNSSTLLLHNVSDECSDEDKSGGGNNKQTVISTHEINSDVIMYYPLAAISNTTVVARGYGGRSYVLQLGP